MAIEVETKDCTALGDVELAEMADLCADGPSRYEAGMLSKQAEAWVLITLVRDNGKLKGFSFSTLERIGGTPSVIIGLAAVKRTAKRDTVLRALMTDELRRAVLAFPDEDVLVGTRFASKDGYEAYKALTDIVPRPDYVATGEERAWGRRLAKRFGIENGQYDERNFVVKGEGDGYPLALDHESLKPEKLDDGARRPVRAGRPEAGRRAHRVRLGPRRRPRQARLTDGAGAGSRGPTRASHSSSANAIAAITRGAIDGPFGVRSGSSTRRTKPPTAFGPRIS